MVNGSPRRRGATASLLHAMEDSLMAFGDVDVRFFDLGCLELTPCKGCCSCYRTGFCCLQDDANAVVDAIEACDALIVGTPTYASNVSGQLKTLIDRAPLVMEQLLSGKRALGVATYQNYGGRNAANILRDVLAHSGALLCGVYKEKIPFNKKIQGSRADLRARQSARRLHRELVRDIRHPFQNFKRRLVFALGIRPFTLAQGAFYVGVQQHWNKRNLT